MVSLTSDTSSSSLRWVIAVAALIVCHHHIPAVAYEYRSYGFLLYAARWRSFRHPRVPIPLRGFIPGCACTGTRSGGENTHQRIFHRQVETGRTRIIPRRPEVNHAAGCRYGGIHGARCQ